ncbi:dihydroneopterin aldolase [Phaeospirillum tilakii]|uniref:7,8-dihydroneopterin aldolase n=1 Tax=Phaeospirillum tilakii TaxID=741673 RepID=A0ABW5CH91_9PROT
MFLSHWFPLAVAERRLHHVFIHDLELEACIGVLAEEKRRRQPVRISLDLAVCAPVDDLRDDPANVVCYERMACRIRALVEAGHLHLVETLAERIAGISLEDPRVRRVRVRVEKPNAVAGAASAGVEIERAA